MKAWRLFPIQNIPDQKAFKSLPELRVLQQNTDKLTDGLERAVKATEAKASALFKEIAAISGAYGVDAKAAGTFLEMATAMHKKADESVKKDAGAFHRACLARVAERLAPPPMSSVETSGFAAEPPNDRYGSIPLKDSLAICAV